MHILKLYVVGLVVRNVFHLKRSGALGRAWELKLNEFLTCDIVFLPLHGTACLCILWSRAVSRLLSCVAVCACMCT